MTTTVSQRGQPRGGPAYLASVARIHTDQCIPNTRRYWSCQRTENKASLPLPQRAVFAAYGDLPDAQARQRMRQPDIRDIGWRIGRMLVTPSVTRPHPREPRAPRSRPEHAAVPRVVTAAVTGAVTTHV